MNQLSAYTLSFIVSLMPGLINPGGPPLPPPGPFGRPGDDGAAERLQGACGWGVGNSIARDIKLAEMLIRSGKPLPAAALADPVSSLKSLLKGVTSV